MIDYRGRGAGKEFEHIVLERLRREAKAGNGHWGRYGVQAAVKGRTPAGDAIAQIMDSLPDIEGTLAPHGQQVIFDCKVISGASLNLHDYIPKHLRPDDKKKRKRRQLEHLYSRADTGAICFLLMHCNSRREGGLNDPTETLAIPVHRKDPFWKSFEEGETTVLSRKVARKIGKRVEWNTLTRQESTYRPDVLPVIHSLIRAPDNQNLCLVGAPPSSTIAAQTCLTTTTFPITESTDAR